MTSLAADPAQQPTSQPGPAENPAAPDRRRAALVFLVCLAVLSYFFGGAGDNQTAQFNTIRALVERGTFEITPYDLQRGSGDVSHVNGKRYATKAPGLSLLGVPVYAATDAFERSAGISPDAEKVWWINQYLVTAWCSAVPGAIIGLTMFFIARRELAPLAAMALAASLPLGTLLLPSGSTLTAHNFDAMCLLIAWALLTRRAPSANSDLLAGGALGLVLSSNYLTAPLTALYAALVLRERRGVMAAIRVCIGPAVAGLLLAAFNAHLFGSPLATSYTYRPQIYQRPDLYFGLFELPKWNRLYYLSFHPFRGMFYLCPVLLIAVLGLIRLTRAPRQFLHPRTLIPLAVVAFFVISVGLCYAPWGGGYHVGARFLIPAIPMLFLFAPRGFQWRPRIAAALMALSIVNMVAVTSVRAMYPGNVYGPPPNENPVAECIRRLTMNEVARQQGSFNLGLLAGIDGAASVIPPAVIIIAFYGWILMRAHSRRKADHVA